MPSYQIIPCNNGTSLSKYQACYNSPQLDGDFETGCDKPLCWETYLGKQFYFLTLFDFGVQVDTSGSDPEIHLILLQNSGNLLDFLGNQLDFRF